MSELQGGRVVGPTKTLFADKNSKSSDGSVKNLSCKQNKKTKQWSSVHQYTIPIPKSAQKYKYYTYSIQTNDDGIVPQNPESVAKQGYVAENRPNACRIGSPAFRKNVSVHKINVRLVDGPSPDKKCRQYPV